MLGIVLFGTTVLIPAISAKQFGLYGRTGRNGTLARWLALMFMMPIAGFVTTKAKIDPRLLVSLGFLGMAITLHRMTVVYTQIDFQTMVLLRMVQVAPIPFIFVPISTLNYVGVPREKSNQVSGLSNFARNIGGSIGTSLLSVFIARQNQAHQNSLIAHTTQGDPNFQAMLAGLKATFIAQGFDSVTAANKALAQMYQIVQAQASALSYMNCFWVMSAIVIVLVPLPFIMRRPSAGTARAVEPAH